MALSPTLASAYTGGKSYMRHLMGVEFLNSHLTGGAVRIVNYDDDISVGGNTHTGLAMEAIQPEIGDQATNDIVLKIDAVQGQLQFWLNAVNIFDEPTLVNLRPFAYNVNTSTVVDVVGTFATSLKKADFSMTQIVITLGQIGLANQAFPKVKYHQDTHPDLYL